MAGNERFNLSSILSSHSEYVPWKISDVLFTYVLIFALSILAVGILITAHINTEASLFPALLQIIISFSTLGVIYLIVTKKYNMSFIEAFGLWYDRIPKFFTQGIFVSIILIISTTLISFIFAQWTGTTQGSPYTALSKEKLRIISMLAIFFAPVVEEIFFRGFMQSALIKSFGPFVGIGATAIIFGASHTQYFNYGTALVAVTTIGVILGIARYKTGSVMPGIFAHLINNLLAAIALL